uniref:ERCC4 domain-containing protein n=1 Tax=viral metagenome TaxID=1070528 RepID=A0A6C0D314_9ZZZZ
MRVIIDERERGLFEKCNEFLQQSKNTSIELFKEVLSLGDILLRSSQTNELLLLIERKTFNDLLASVKDGRYEEQSYRLSNSDIIHPHSIIYLIEGLLSQIRTPLDKKVIYSAMTSLQVYKGFSTHRTGTVSETAEWILQLAEKIDKEISKGKQFYYKKATEIDIATTNTIDNTNITQADYCKVVKKVKKDNVSPENIGEIILCQIPGISSVTAIAIMQRFKTFPNLIVELNTNPLCFENLVIETGGNSRKISKSALDNIRRFLLATPTES